MPQCPEEIEIILFQALEIEIHTERGGLRSPWEHVAHRSQHLTLGFRTQLVAIHPRQGTS
jgi:hypothetical protein